MKTFTTLYARGGYPTMKHESLAAALRYALNRKSNGVVIRLTENGTIIGSTRTESDPVGFNAWALGFPDEIEFNEYGEQIGNYYTIVSDKNLVTHFRFDHMRPSLTQLARAGYELGNLAGIPTN